MKKYSALFITFVGIIFPLFLVSSQQNIAHAQPVVGQPPVISIKKCNSNQDCISLTSVNQLVCNLGSHICQSPVGANSNCTVAGTGQGNCSNNFTCAVLNPQICSMANPRNAKVKAIQQACQTTCQPIPLKQLGQACTGSGTGKCDTSLDCYQNKCIKRGQVGDACTSTSSQSTQGSCAAGLLCNNGTVNAQPAQQCLHTGAGCGTFTVGAAGHCIAPNANPLAAVQHDPTPIPPPPSPPCKQWSGNGVCQTFGSTFGGFSTSPAGFIQKIFAVLLSVSGGIALLLIIKAGYQLMTAQGKPEQLQNGRDQLIAAIVGLVFLIFSFVFLQLIGFDILHIPGFGGTGGGASAQYCNSVGLQYCSKIGQCFPASSTCP